MKKVREVECYRHNVTPREFWRYCEEKAVKHGTGLYIDYEEWIDPMTRSEYTVVRHPEEDGGFKEGWKYLPMNYQMYCEGSWNFIMEWDDGIGYMYIAEWDN